MKKLILILPLLFGTLLYGQSENGIHQGMVRFQGTAAMGFETSNKVYENGEQRYYVYGEVEYLLSDHLGINGAFFANLGSSEKIVLTRAADPSEDGYVHSTFAGPIYHFLPQQALDLYVGIQPGFSYSTVHTTAANDGVISESQFGPAGSVLTGAAYYGSFFHLFAQARYVASPFSSNSAQRNFNDLRLCIGLGFNFN